MKKKLLATLLVLCMILPSFGGLSALALDVIDMGDNATLICDNPYNKIHFYFDDSDNATIDDAAELQAATAAVKGDYAAALMAADGEGEVNENVYITVQFASDYMETNEYEVFKAALESATTPRNARHGKDPTQHLLQELPRGDHRRKSAHFGGYSLHRGECNRLFVLRDPDRPCRTAGCKRPCRGSGEFECFASFFNRWV